MKKVDPKVLLDNEIINQETYEKIIEFTEGKKDSLSQTKKVNLLMNIVAWIFIVLGVIWIVAANWAVIPGVVKVVLGFLAMTASLIYLMNEKNKGKNLEVPSIIYCAFTIIEIALISQYFNTSPNLGLFAIVSILIIGLVSLYSYSFIASSFCVILSVILAIGCPNLFTLFDFSKNTFLVSEDWLGILLSFILLGIIPRITFSKVKINLFKENENIQKRIYKSLCLIAFAIMLFEYVIINSSEYGAIIPVVYIMYLITKCAKVNKQSNIYRAAILVILFIASIVGTEIFDNDMSVNVIIMFVISILICIYYLRNYLIARKEYKNELYKNTDFNDAVTNHDKHKELIRALEIKKLDAKDDMLLMITSVIWPLFNIVTYVLEECFDMYGFDEANKIIFIVYVIYLAVHYMKEGIVENLISKIYLGEFLLACELLRLLFTVTDSLMIRGVLSVIVAVVVLIFNKKNFKKMNKKA